MTLTRTQLQAILTEYIRLMKQLGEEQKTELDKIVHGIEQQRIAEIHAQINELH